MAGTYRVAVEAGEEAPADFTKRLYKGEETFTVKPGETTNVAVVCQIVNTVVEVKFDDSILQNLAPGYSVWIAGGEKVDEQAAEAGSVPALRFTTEGISLEPVDKYNVRLTLSDAFFASCQAGDQKVTLRIEDANGGSSEVATTYRLEGLVPVTADDYDLWANTVTLRVVSFTPGTTVQFGLRSSGGEWQPMAGTSQGDDFITATYAPQWVPQTVKEQTVCTPGRRHRNHRDTQLRLQSHYQRHGNYRNIHGRRGTANPQRRHVGLEHDRRLRFSQAAGESFWSSGNNTMTKTLCTSTDVKFGKSAPAAKLTSTNMLVLAAGNLFTGEFAYKSFTGWANVHSDKHSHLRTSFGNEGKIPCHVGTVDKVRTSGDICPYIKKGDPDMARIFVAIVDWNAPQRSYPA